VFFRYWGVAGCVSCYSTGGDSGDWMRNQDGTALRGKSLTAAFLPGGRGDLPTTAPNSDSGQIRAGIPVHIWIEILY